MRTRLPGLLPGGVNPIVRDVTSQGLGALSYTLVNGRSQLHSNGVIIPANTPIPARHSSVRRTLRDNQNGIEWEVTQGNDEDPAYVRIVGTGWTPLPPYPAGARVELTFMYDANQTIHAEAVDLQTGRLVGRFRVDNVANLTPEQVKDATMRVRRADLS